MSGNTDNGGIVRAWLEPINPMDRKYEVLIGEDGRSLVEVFDDDGTMTDRLCFSIQRCRDGITVRHVFSAAGLSEKSSGEMLQICELNLREAIAKLESL